MSPRNIKPLLISGFLLSFAALFMARAQDSANFPPFASGSPATQPNSTEDLRTALVSYLWTWERSGIAPEAIRFLNDNTFKPFKATTFLITSPRVVELRMGKRKAILKFNADLTTYNGIDFDGVRPIHGHRGDPVPQ
jgi:hypothetical protein